MEVVYFALFLIIILLSVNLVITYKNNSEKNETDLGYKIESMNKEIGRVEYAVKTEIANNRSESNEAAKSARVELSESLTQFTHQVGSSMRDNAQLQKEQLIIFSQNLQSLTKSIEEKLASLTSTIDNRLIVWNEANTANSKENRKEVKESLDTFRKDFSKSVEDFNALQKDNFFALLNKQTEQNSITMSRMDEMRVTLQKGLSEMQMGNEKKLEEMRATVDEKLQKTLETRLGESFKLVSERLEAVHKGLGDMQVLATGVGDLKKVLTNVKTRGVLGEYQLGNILEQLLTPDQYAKNVKTKEGSNAIVEFAVKLPGRDDKESNIWLPIDSKFPKEDFELLMEAYDNADLVLVEESRKSFVRGIKKCAADICGKYIDPPQTTDFAILFVPFESLYAEVLRTPGLFESIQSECRIIIAGPTTLSALLNSLQMGFKTLAIERRSSEVWSILGAVKTEFKNFGVVLDKTQKKLQEASNVIESANVRSRAIERRLKDVQELPSLDTAEMIVNAVEKNEFPDL